MPPEETGVPDPSGVQMSDEPPGRAPGAPRTSRMKRTFHLPPEDVYALDAIQADDHRRTGRKPELSHLVSEAIRLLREQRRQVVPDR